MKRKHANISHNEIAELTSKKRSANMSSDIVAEDSTVCRTAKFHHLHQSILNRSHPYREAMAVLGPNGQQTAQEDSQAIVTTELKMKSCDPRDASGGYSKGTSGPTQDPETDGGNSRIPESTRKWATRYFLMNFRIFVF